MPASNNMSIGQMANFRCNHSAPGTIGWQVNDSSLMSLGPKSSHVTSRIFRHPDGSALSILTIKAISDFNQSSVRCLALFDGAQAEYSPRALLQIQGIGNDSTSIIKLLMSIIPKDPWMLSRI